MKTGEKLGTGEVRPTTEPRSPPMTMSAQSIARVDHFADARAELEAVFKQLSEAGVSHHVMLGKLITEGMTRVGPLCQHA